MAVTLSLMTTYLLLSFARATTEIPIPYPPGASCPKTRGYEYAPIDENFVTYCDLNNTLRGQLKDKFNNFTTFHDLIGKLARLIFHDCFGPKEFDPFVPAICDGCIDHLNPKHAGLPHEVEKIDRIFKAEYKEGVPERAGHQNWFKKMSRADFWAACATIAIQEASFQPNTSWRMLPVSEPIDILPYIPFYIGREDCSASPEIDISNYQDTKSIKIDGIDTEIVAKSFGEATGGFDDNFALFEEGFGLNEREYVALLGVHTLGRVKSTNSGFGDKIGKPWVEAWDVLDNAFYQMLLDDGQRTDRSLDWIQHHANNGTSEFWEWRDTMRAKEGDVGPTRFVMLNSDMALIKDLDNLPGNAQLNTTSGECPFKSYGQLTEKTHGRNNDRQYVRDFAADNQLWLLAFGNVWDRMIRAGYDNRNRVPRDGKLTLLAEQWYFDEYKKAEEFDLVECSHIVEIHDITDPEWVHGKLKWAGCGPDGNNNCVEAAQGQAILKVQNLTRCVGDLTLDEINTIDPDGLWKENVDYLWNWTWTWISDKSGYISIDMIACCGEDGAVFPDGFIENVTAGSSRWTYVGLGDDTFFGDDDDLTQTEIVIKHIIVWGIVGLLLCLCIIGGTILYKKYKNKKLELEKETAEMTQPISPGHATKNKSKAKKESTVDVRTPIIDLEGGATINGNGVNSNDIPASNPYVIANNSSTASFDQHR